MAADHGEKRRWIIASAVALGVVGAGVAMVRVPAPASASAPPPAAKAPLQIARPGPTDELLRQETELRDLRPLFLPTARNAALPERPREPRRALLEEDNPMPKLADAELSLDRELPPVVTLGGKGVDKATAVDGLGLDSDLAGLAGIGRRPIVTAELPARGGFLEVVSSRDGRRIMSETLPVAAKPATEKPWSPVEFFAAIDASGLTSPLVVAEGSRVEEVDSHFRQYLTRDFRIGLRLPPGFYRVTVAP